MARIAGEPSSQSNAHSANKRARGRRLSISASRETTVREEVADALAATPAEKIEAMAALLDSV